MMKSYLAAIFFITCFLCASSVPVPSPPAPPRPDQVEILFAIRDEFPPLYCDPVWQTSEYILQNTNMSHWTKDANYFIGVNFDDRTGVVTELNLQGSCIGGTIQDNSSLFKLQHLRSLDLSRNHFESSPIPAGIGRLASLEGLYLTETGFMGEVPSSISNLSRLNDLILYRNNLTGRFPPVHNLTELSYISLSYNQFSGTIPSSLFTMPSLSHLDLRQNHFKDPLENINSSATSKLGYLYLAENLLSCRILEPVSKLANLIYLDLSFLNTTCNFDFFPLKSLKGLTLSGNSISRLITGSANLSELILSSCNITEFPMFIKTLQNLEELDISKNRLEGKVPEWLWDLPSLLKVNLSYNSFNILEGSPKVLLNSSLKSLDLSFNAFQGSFPIIPPTIDQMVASNNNFSGGLPLSFCNATRPRRLDLSDNNFNGLIPQCLMNTSNLAVLKLNNNNLTGKLPDMCLRPNISVPSLVLLDVGYNQISGKLPRSLAKCIQLQFLNVESNRINDTFPFWLRDLELRVMVLRSNRFYGPLSSPRNPLSFTQLRVIDIADNYFTGSLPPNYFLNWSSPMVNTRFSPDYIGNWHYLHPTPEWYFPSIYLRNKGQNREYEKIQEMYIAIDFSGNKLEGQIPESIGFLKSLMALDLSNNNFTGHIPSSLSNLTQLESLDLSQNQLSGKIPQELVALTFLSYINMSHNKFTGQIPKGSQIGGQPKSCFEGNLNLCGLPLEENCFKKNEAPSTPPNQEAEQEQVLNWKAAVIGYGPGVLFGVAITQVLATYKPVLFYKLFRL